MSWMLFVVPLSNCRCLAVYRRFIVYLCGALFMFAYGVLRSCYFTACLTFIYNFSSLCSWLSQRLSVKSSFCSSRLRDNWRRWVAMFSTESRLIIACTWESRRQQLDIFQFVSDYQMQMIGRRPEEPTVIKSNSLEKMARRKSTHRRPLLCKRFSFSGLWVFDSDRTRLFSTK